MKVRDRKLRNVHGVWCAEQMRIKQEEDILFENGMYGEESGAEGWWDAKSTSGSAQDK